MTVIRPLMQIIIGVAPEAGGVASNVKMRSELMGECACPVHGIHPSTVLCCAVGRELRWPELSPVGGEKMHVAGV
jgi:hypothetical protein